MDQDNTYLSKSDMSFDLKPSPIFSSRASVHNVYMTYVCLVNEGLPNTSRLDKKKDSNDPDKQDHDFEDENDVDSPVPIQVERSKAVHELVESLKKADQDVKEQPTTTYTEESDASDQEDDNKKYENPKALKLTKMKWLTEDRPGYPDSSSPSVSSARSTTSSAAEESDDDSANKSNIGEKCLSTILRLDKEHNLFGLSSIAIIGSKQSRPTKQSRKDDEKPVFHQTAIVQYCASAGCRAGCGPPCSRPCCRYKSNTDMPSSIRDGGCSSCVIMPCEPVRCPPKPRSSCLSTCTVPCYVPPPSCAFIPRTPKIHASCLPDTPQLALTCYAKDPDSPPCSPCPPEPPPCARGPVCTCGLTAFLPPEPADCCYGLRLKLNRKPNHEPAPHEIAPRCPSELQKPLMARCCTHNPVCQPPSPGFPYLMPCFWPCRPSAPCLDPTMCFHHPPCMPPRRPKGIIPENQTCPRPGPCKDSTKKTECHNKSCLGAQSQFQKGLTAWGKLEPPKKKTHESKHASSSPKSSPSKSSPPKSSPSSGSSKKSEEKAPTPPSPTHSKKDKSEIKLDIKKK